MLLAPNSTLRAYRFTLHGRVQGCGVRPAIARLAQEYELGGFVGNCAEGVVIHVEGTASSIESFQGRLEISLPTGAVLTGLRVEVAIPIGNVGFSIEASSREGPLSAVVPSDVAMCTECRDEVSTATNRRFEYPFTTCTQCGPRYSLIHEMPYDRPNTGMASFKTCPICRQEYASPDDRRFHSQTNCCPECGPQIWLEDVAGQVLGRGAAALERAIELLRDGKIVALRGIGGYQLLADATSSVVVHELRRRKQRFGKPLAVMVHDMEAAQQLAIVGEIEWQVLASAANPITVLPMRNSEKLSPEISAGLDKVGMMLPTTPLHALLCHRSGLPLVVTSGNLEGDPLEYDSAAALQNLSAIAEFWLDHNRPILRPVDDSVVRVIAGRSATIRLARGLAPMPLELSSEIPMVALGGHQKAAVALTNGAQAVLGPHVGDLNSETTRERFLKHVESLRQLYGVVPKLLVHDLHPDYFTTRWAAGQNVPTMAVQHHHAHVVAGMLEHNLLDRPVLGVAWDGTGYGPDGTIWGGEFLLATATDFQRVASFHPFTLVGGETAVKQPWRTAVALVYEACGPEAAARLRFHDVQVRQIERFVSLLSSTKLSLQTTSAGRLFDGVAALLFGLAESHFEGQPAMLLESSCDPLASGQYPIPLRAGEPLTLDWRPLVNALLEELRVGVTASEIAMKFHRSLAEGIAAVVDRYSEVPVVLCGGCFQNVILTELVAERLANRSQPVATPGLIPVNDGGLAAGQLAVAIARLRRKDQRCA